MMRKNEKKICPCCNYLGIGEDVTCPYCGLALISECPECKAHIRVVFAKYCYICGFRFEDAVNTPDGKEGKSKENPEPLSTVNDNRIPALSKPGKTREEK